MSNWIDDNSRSISLRDEVFYRLRSQILRGDLKPGARLLEIKLAGEMGVSRTPVREAIHMLQLEGLVANVPRKGAHVAQITEKDLRDVLEVRSALEGLAVRLACSRITEEQKVKLWEASKVFEGCVGDDSLERLAEADELFHEQIYEATGNERLLQMLLNIKDQMYRYRMEYLKDQSSRKQLILEHQTLCSALETHDADLAEKAMKTHIDRQEAYILHSILEMQK